MLPLLLCNNLYKSHKKAKDEDLSYLNIIIDEAHNILSYQSNRESETWKDYRLEVFEEIIKEGRKFGFVMDIITQRPTELSETVLKNTYSFLLQELWH